MSQRRLSRNLKPFYMEYTTRPTNYLEIGVYRGGSISWMLDNVLIHPESRAWGIDHWSKEHWPRKLNDVYKETIDAIGAVSAKYGNKLNLIRGLSHEILGAGKFEKEFFDIIYIDGHHTVMAVMRDFVYTWPLLKVGGIMIFDDYKQSTNQRVEKTVDVILYGMGEKYNSHRLQRGSKIELLFKNRQVGIRKLAE